MSEKTYTVSDEDRKALRDALYVARVMYEADARACDAIGASDNVKKEFEQRAATCSKLSTLFGG